jgi:hypothetical protein
MKNLLTNSISTTVGFPVKSGTLDFLQTASSEMLIALGRSIIGRDFSTSTPYALYGCNNTGSGSSYVIEAGAILWDGVLYLVPAVSFTLTGGNSVYVATSTTYVTSSVADPVTFTDGVARSVHADTKMSVYQNALAPSPSAGFAYSAIVKMSDIAHYVGSGGVEPSFGAGWANSTSYPNDNLRFYMINNQVFIRGTIKRVSSTTIFTLPSEYRPTSGDRYFFGTNITVPALVGLYIVGSTGVVNTTGSGATAVDMVIDFSYFI